LPVGAGRAPQPGPGRPVRIGVLAVQGGFAAHLKHLGSAGSPGIEVRTPGDLEGLDGLILPGGESTTIGMGLERDSLSEGLIDLAGRGVPVLGTCAGMILAGADQLDLIDIDVRRNAFGRQLASFETELAIPRLVGSEPYRAIFIRAPWIERVGEGVEVLAEVDGHPVAARSGSVTVLSFHPELSADDRIHHWFVEACREASSGGAKKSPVPDSTGQG